MGLAFVSLMFGTVLRSTILAALCGLLLWIFRVRVAELKHLLWRIVLLALFALPILQIATPPLRRASQVALLVESAMRINWRTTGITPKQVTRRITESLDPPISEKRHPWTSAVVAVYLSVTCGLLARLATGLYRLKRIAGGSEFIADKRLHGLAHDAWLESGAGLKPRVRVSAEISVPMAVDLDDALILLPHSWQEWNEEKLRAVLMHEMAHVSRRDSSSAFICSLAVCLFWFHPLSWFLRQHLAELAEEACDEAALRTVSAPEQYARILTDFAADVARQSGRVLVAASTAVRGSRIKKRLKHIFAISGREHKTRGAIRILLLAILFPAVYVTAAARFDGMQRQNGTEDLTPQQKLLDSYLEAGEKAQFTQELVRIIQHDPDSRLAGMMTSVAVQVGGPIDSPQTLEAVKSAWEQSLTEHPNSPGAHWGLGICVERDDPERALKLFQRAQQLAKNDEAKNYLSSIAAIYTAAVMADLHLANPNFHLNDIAVSLNTATKLRTQLESSNDPALLSYVGKMLVSFSESPGKDAQSEVGLDYLKRAVDLDPGNPQWKEALEAARAEPARRRAFAALKQSGGAPAATVRIGAGVANANLLKKVDPQYPPLALQARIQGTVEFDVVIDADGRVTKMRLVRGHPLLVPAAQRAVLQWVYRPTMLNGKPIAVSTEVMVPFELPQ